MFSETEDFSPIPNDSDNVHGGYIKLYRSIKNHWIWDDPVKLKWWLDIILSCRYSHKKVNIKGQIINCNRGQCIKSLETYAREWRSNKATVKRFLELLSIDNMLTIENLKVTTRITVCNYDSYNDSRNADETQMKRRCDADETHLKLIKKGKKDKKEKNIEVIPILSDFTAYFEEKGYREDIAKKAFDYYSANDWKDSRGNKVKNWKQKCIAVWFKPEHEKTKLAEQPKNQLPTTQDILKQRYGNKNVNA